MAEINLGRKFPRGKRSSGAGAERTIENGFPVGAEGFDEDVLGGLVVLLAGIEFPAALGLAEMDPVGGAVARVLEARDFRRKF